MKDRRVDGPVPDWRTLLVIVLMLGSATAVGAVAGYRMYVQEVVLDDTEPVSVNVTVTLPDNSTFNGTFELVGRERNAFDALRALGTAENLSVEHREFSGDVYVYAIDGHAAEGSCGWLYAIDGTGPQYQPDVASNHVVLDEGQSVHWYWGCV